MSGYSNIFLNEFDLMSLPPLIMVLDKELTTYAIAAKVTCDKQRSVVL